jgi:hypothetical protein
MGRKSNYSESYKREAVAKAEACVIHKDRFKSSINSASL